jgi:hypothetical protein
LISATLDRVCQDNRQPVKLNPSVAKVGGLQSQDAKGAAVINLLQALGNAGSGVLRLSCRVKKMALNSPKLFELFGTPVFQFSMLYFYFLTNSLPRTTARLTAGGDNASLLLKTDCDTPNSFVAQ